MSTAFAPALALVLTALTSLPTLGAQTSNWAGSWTSQPDRDVEVIRIQPGTGTARGWNGFVDALIRQRDYRIEITQADDDVAIAFPGGAANMLSVPAFTIDRPVSHVVNRGEWWTQQRTTARWVDRELELAATTFSGWWRTSTPDQAQPKPTDFRQRVLLTQGGTPDELVLRATLTDEKGEVEYVQRFHRNR